MHRDVCFSNANSIGTGIIPPLAALDHARNIPVALARAAELFASSSSLHQPPLSDALLARDQLPPLPERAVLESAPSSALRLSYPSSLADTVTSGLVTFTVRAHQEAVCHRRGIRTWDATVSSDRPGSRTVSGEAA